MFATGVVSSALTALCMAIKWCKPLVWSGPGANSNSLAGLYICIVWPRLAKVLKLLKQKCYTGEMMLSGFDWLCWSGHALFSQNNSAVDAEGCQTELLMIVKNNTTGKLKVPWDSQRNVFHPHYNHTSNLLYPDVLILKLTCPFFGLGQHGNIRWQQQAVWICTW